MSCFSREKFQEWTKHVEQATRAMVKIFFPNAVVFDSFKLLEKKYVKLCNDADKPIFRVSVSLAAHSKIELLCVIMIQFYICSYILYNI